MRRAGTGILSGPPNGAAGRPRNPQQPPARTSAWDPPNGTAQNVQAAVIRPAGRCLPAGHTIFSGEDPAAYFYEIGAGVVRCCHLTSQGKRQIIRFAGIGDFVGFGGDARHGYSAEVVENCEVFPHRSAGLDERLSHDGALRDRLTMALQRELQSVRRYAVLLGRKTAAAKLADLLLGLDDLAAQPGGFVSLPMCRNDMADYLCMSAETVCRKFAEFGRMAIIEVASPREFRILDRPGLEGIVAEA